MYTPEQQLENRRTWVAELRSGRYQQGKARLRNGRGFCCLGVATDVCMKATGQGSWQWEGVGYIVVSDEDGRNLGNISMPQFVCDWLGINENLGTPKVTYQDERHYLSDLNDHGHSFEEIADLIEREYING